MFDTLLDNDNHDNEYCYYEYYCCIIGGVPRHMSRDGLVCRHVEMCGKKNVCRHVEMCGKKNNLCAFISCYVEQVHRTTESIVVHPVAHGCAIGAHGRLHPRAHNCAIDARLCNRCLDKGVHPCAACRNAR